MGGESKETIKVVLDTNIFIFGYSDILEEEKSHEEFIIRNLANNPQFIITLSDELEEQILRVAKRMKGKDWAGILKYFIWRDFNIQFISTIESAALLEDYRKIIPRKDQLIFLTALLGRIDYLVSTNRAFIQSAAKEQNLFQCLSPEKFIRRVLEKISIPVG